jgi:hypothetical protein
MFASRVVVMLLLVLSLCMTIVDAACPADKAAWQKLNETELADVVPSCFTFESSIVV